MKDPLDEDQMRATEGAQLIARDQCEADKQTFAGACATCAMEQSGFNPDPVPDPGAFETDCDDGLCESCTQLVEDIGESDDD